MYTGVRSRALEQQRICHQNVLQLPVETPWQPIIELLGADQKCEELPQADTTI